MVKYVIIPVLIFFSVRSFSQEIILTDNIANVAEELAADDGDPEAAAEYMERLQELAENPVKLNSADDNEISRLFFLSDFQVKALADYAHSSGRIISIYELANIPGFDKETAEMMIPFIILNNNVNMNSAPVRLRNRAITNLSVKSANDDTTSLGSSLKILTKYKFVAGGVSAGFTVEKDPGERFFSGTPPLPDFLSAHIVCNGSGLIRRIIVGDYSARFGQGTNINTGIRTGLSLTLPGYMSASDEIKPYTSTDENNFFRGVAAVLSVKNLGISCFYSKNYLDATIGSSSGSTKDHIENFYKAGIHNTSIRLLKKDAISELVYGINLSYNFKNIRVGLVLSEDRFSLPVNPTGYRSEDIFNFTGDRNNLYTIYYNSLIKRVLLYGEFSINENYKHAIVQGLSFRPSDRLTINFLFRNYNAGYISFHGRGPGGGSASGNEQGILGNFNFEAAKHLFISGGCDIQHFPWLKYNCSSPSWGLKQEIRARFLPTEILTFEASYNNRIWMVDNSTITGIPEQNLINGRTLKGSVRYSLAENMLLITRVDYKYIDPSGSKGMLLLQDLNYRFRSIPVSIWTRYCIFNTDDWDSRLYTYENDLLNSFSIPALSGNGRRSYLMVKWEISDFAEIRLKYSITSLAESSTTFKNREEVRFQFKLMF